MGPAESRTPPRPPSRRAPLDELPPAPWAPFPLVELCILVGIVCAVAGLFRGAALLVFGLALVTLSTLEQTLREHLAGFRSHTILLAGTIAVAAATPMFLLTGLPQTAILVAGGVIFGAAWWALRDVFRRRAGGLSFRA